MTEPIIYNKVAGCLIGGLIGDAMGAPVENWHYEKIEEKYGLLADFTGAGTDDSAVKLLLCKAILKGEGHATSDLLAEAFLENPQYYDLYYVPVRNMYHKLKDEIDLPINAGFNNAPSSSSAMSISPMGIINLCNPRAAAREAFEVATLIHSGSTAFCRDAACAVAAAVAQAMRADATVDSVVEASTAYLHSRSASLMISLIRNALSMAKECGEYKAFRREYYRTCLYNTICDSRETVPATLALFYLAGGDVVKSIQYGANFGRDADTIASMVGALAGAFRGLRAFPEDWVNKAYSENANQKELAGDMTRIAVRRYEEYRALIAAVDAIVS